jgi:hypothetical protein
MSFRVEASSFDWPGGVFVTRAIGRLDYRRKAGMCQFVHKHFIQETKLLCTATMLHASNHHN